MALETQEREINGRKYAVTQLPAFRALDVFESISKVAGPALAAMQGAGLDGNLAPAAETLFKGLAAGQLRALAKELLSSATVEIDGSQGARAVPVLPIFDLHFAGKLGEAFQLMAFAVEVNFTDFFDGARTLLAKRPQRAAPESASISPSA